jgi:hypothetical protein
MQPSDQRIPNIELESWEAMTLEERTEILLRLRENYPAGHSLGPHRMLVRRPETLSALQSIPPEPAPAGNGRLGAACLSPG